MRIWVFLHIAFMFSSVALTGGLVWFALHAAWQRDVGALPSYFRMASCTSVLEGVLPVLGIASGLVAAVAIGWDLLEGWLLVAYILVAVAVVVVSIGGRHAARVRLALEANEGDVPSQELEAALASRRPYAWNVASTVILFLLIWDMVYEPAF